MTRGHLPLIDTLVSGLGRGARAAVRRAAIVAAAGVLAAVGCGFVVFAAFATLRLLVGPELAALVCGVIFLALAALLLRLVQRPPVVAQPIAAAPPPMAAATTDPATLAIFTVAFVLGRRLADRWRG